MPLPELPQYSLILIFNLPYQLPYLMLQTLGRCLFLERFLILNLRYLLFIYLFFLNVFDILEGVSLLHGHKPYQSSDLLYFPYLEHSIYNLLNDVLL